MVSKINIILPLMTYVYVFFIIILVILNGDVSPIFIICCLEMFLNWYCVFSISWRSSTIKDSKKKYRLSSVTIKPSGDSMAYKHWYCKKCQVGNNKPARHCHKCEKCYHFMDHHCLLLGTCVLRQNMGNFILCCFYASLASLYSLFVIGGWMYVYLYQIIYNNTDQFNLFENFCFPVALVRLLAQNLMFLYLSLVFGMLIAIFACSMSSACWKLYACLNGKQYYAYLTGKQNLKDIFGSYGLLNVFFPYNGLIGDKRSINDCRFQLKEV